MLAMSVDVLAGYAGRTPLCHGAIFGASTYVVIYASDRIAACRCSPALVLGVLAATALAACVRPARGTHLGRLLPAAHPGARPHHLGRMPALDARDGRRERPARQLARRPLRRHPPALFRRARRQPASPDFGDVALRQLAVRPDAARHQGQRKPHARASATTCRCTCSSPSRCRASSPASPARCTPSSTTSSARRPSQLVAIGRRAADGDRRRRRHAVRLATSAPPSSSLLEQRVSAYTERWLMVLGAMFVLIMIFAPEGVVGKAGRWRRDRLEARMGASVEGRVESWIAGDFLKHHVGRRSGRRHRRHAGRRCAPRPEGRSRSASCAPLTGVLASGGKEMVDGFTTVLGAARRGSPAARSRS